MTRPPAAPARHAPGAKRTPFALLLGGLVVGGLCALLALNTASAANEVQRHDLALRDQNIAARVVQLQNDQQASAAPANLARAAEALGMVPAGNPGFLEIGSDGHVRLMGRAAPATAAPLPVPSQTPTHHGAQHKKSKSTKSQKTQKSQKAKKSPKKSGQQNKKKSDQQNKKTTKKSKKAQKPPKTSDTTTKTAKNKHHPKHHAQSHHERRAGAPITTITIPGGPR
jgi:cobalamin biosynthesis Mg chelatase CobN